MESFCTTAKGNLVLKWLNLTHKIYYFSILLFCDNVIMGFSGLNQAAFDGEKTGRLFLTSHRMVFNNKSSNDPLKSFSFPFVALRNVELEQPVFGANYIKGKVLAQPKWAFFDIFLLMMYYLNNLSGFQWRLWRRGQVQVTVSQWWSNRFWKCHAKSRSNGF